MENRNIFTKSTLLSVFFTIILFNLCTSTPVAREQKNRVRKIRQNRIYDDSSLYGEKANNLGKSDYNLQSLDEPPNYDFEYQIHGGGNFFGHMESRSDSQTNGMYFVILPDFRRQVVKYFVDSTGYHAKVTYEPIAQQNNQYQTNSVDSNNNNNKRRNSKKVLRKRVAVRGKQYNI